MTVLKCFVSGSQIRTSRGEFAVQDISVGQTVTTIRGGEQMEDTVTWVGSWAADVRDFPEFAAPVRIRRDAIADGQPTRDLLVSREHCLFVDGLLIPAKRLVNGGSIANARELSNVTYWHIELERHGLLIADGTLTESYLDTGNRHAYDLPGSSVTALRRDVSQDFESKAWETDACAPLARTVAEIEPIWDRLARRSEALGFAIPEVIRRSDPNIHLIADGLDIMPTDQGLDRYLFVVPAGSKEVRLASRFGVPADLVPAYKGDERKLGIAVSRLAIHSDSGEVLMAADDPRLVDGWHDAERDGTAVWRWTDGNALLPWDSVCGPAMVTVRCSPAEVYPDYGPHMRLVA